MLLMFLRYFTFGLLAGDESAGTATPPTTPPPATPPATPPPTPEDEAAADELYGDLETTDKRVKKLADENAKRRVENNGLKAKIAALETGQAKVTDLETQVKTLAEQAKTANEKAAKAARDTAVIKVAAKHGIPDDLLDAFASIADDKLEEYAAKLEKHIAKPGGTNLSLGNSGASPESLAKQFLDRYEKTHGSRI